MVNFVLFIVIKQTLKIFVLIIISIIIIIVIKVSVLRQVEHWVPDFKTSIFFFSIFFFLLLKITTKSAKSNYF